MQKSDSKEINDKQQRILKAIARNIKKKISEKSFLEQHISQV